MSWYLKAAGFKLLSALPGGTKFYAFAQERITKSTVATRARVGQKIDVGLHYWDWLKQHNHAGRFAGGTMLDLGAGWHPTIPLLFYSLGVNRQLLLDVAARMDARRVDDALQIFCDVVSDPAWPRRGELARLPAIAAANAVSASDVLEPLGISYHAPYQKTFPALPNSVDAVFSTQVLQYLTKERQLELFRWLHRILKPGGLFMATIHLVGQFGHPPFGTGRYEHLVFSPWTWDNLINSSLMSHNRLLGPDYRETLQQAGFRIREFALEPPTPAELAGFKRTPVHPCFSRYTAEDLAAKHLFFVAEKA